MKRSILIATTFICCVLLCGNLEAKKPNILIINIDDMGWKDVGFMGSEYYNSPNIDMLASEGVVFTQAYAGAANCAPSRACLMSGEWTPRHQIYTVGSSERGKAAERKLIPTENNETLGDEFVTIAEALKAGGYTTWHAGKWHLTNNPENQGFDENIAGFHAGSPKGGYYGPFLKIENIEKGKKGDYLTDRVMDRAIELVENHDDKTPFFLYYSPYAVHTPIQQVDSLMYKYENKAEWNGQKNAKYATMVDNVDRNIGNLITALKEKGVYSNTLIIFTTDNGGLIPVTEQRPLKAGKGAYYEGGIRTPFFISWKGKIKHSINEEVAVTNLDIYPTVIEAAGIKAPKNYTLDGTSILKTALGKEQPELKERPLFWHFPIYLQTQGGATVSFFRDKFFRTRPGSVVRKGDWKLHQYFENEGDIELFNLAEDIGEENNLADSNPDKVKELLTILKEWQKQVNAPIPTELNPEYSPK